jgi:hypothetical protein
MVPEASRFRGWRRVPAATGKPVPRSICDGIRGSERAGRHDIEIGPPLPGPVDTDIALDPEPGVR